jgi:hypothetical protein
MKLTASLLQLGVSNPKGWETINNVRGRFSADLHLIT